MPKADAKQHDTTIVKRASARHQEDEHGGAWKVAFADFCLALLCLFLVLWLMNARESEAMREQLRASGGRLPSEHGGVIPESLYMPRGSLIERSALPSDGDTDAEWRLRGNSAQSEDGAAIQGLKLPQGRLESRADLQALARYLELLAEQAKLSSHVQSIVTPYGLRVMLHDTDKEGMFRLGSSQPSPRFVELLHKMGPLFAQIENQMLIVGHTDSRQYAGGELAGFSNWTLSNNRAMNARAELMEGGMPARSVLQVVGMADRAPLVPADTLAAANRRIELLVLTTAHARAVTDMFGTPGEGTQSQPPGTATDTPAERAELGTLRQQLQPNNAR